MVDASELTSPHLTVTVEGPTVVLCPKDRLLMSAQARELDRLSALLREKKHDRFVLDLSQCDYVSSEGLGSTADLWKWCHEEGRGHMSIVLSRDVHNEVNTLFEITGLARAIGSAIQPTLRDALNYIREFS